MKKLIVLLLCVLLVTNAMFLGFVLTVKSIYPRFVRVVGVEYDNDLVIAEDSMGFIWTWEGVEDWCCGDGVALIIFNNFTPKTIRDDAIVAMRYSGM